MYRFATLALFALACHAEAGGACPDSQGIGRPCPQVVSNVGKVKVTTYARPEGPAPPSPTPEPGSNGGWMRIVLTFTPDPAIEAESFRVTLEYSINEVNYKESRTAERAETVTVIFDVQPFVFGTVKVGALTEKPIGSFPVFNPLVR